MKKNFFPILSVLKSFFIPLLIAQAGSSKAEPFALEMNDVSLLLPLPKSDFESTLMLRPDSQGQYGELLPTWLWNQLPVLRAGISQATIKSEMRVVAIRFDPCFQEGTQNPVCQSQIRFVFQPLASNVLEHFDARDTAVHAFYVLPVDELRSVVKKIQFLSVSQRESFIGKPLSVHPLLLKEGFNSNVFAEVKNLLLDSVGERRLKRITFMTVGGTDTQWTFGGFDITAPQQSRDMMIPGVRQSRQSITSDITTPAPMRNFIAPQSNSKDHLMRFSRGDEILTDSKTNQIALMQRLHRVENPNFHNPGTVDCVSCHLATMARAWSVEKKIESAEHSRDSFNSVLNLLNTSQANPRNNVLRAFGYFDHETSISSRTIHETAISVQKLEQ